MANLLSPVIAATIDHLVSTAVAEVKMQWGVAEEVDNLLETLSSIKDVLADAEEKRVASRSLRNWLHKLKEAAYDAEDVIEEFKVDALQAKVEREAGLHYVSKVNGLFSCFSCRRGQFRREIGLKIKGIRVRLDKIARERHDLQLTTYGDGYEHPGIKERPQTSSLVVQSKVFGREQDKQKIIELLVSDTASKAGYAHPLVVPIVGMGGIGKTTLAQMVYNDERIENHFQVRAWVWVSEDFDVAKITKAIWESATVSKSDLVELDPQQRQLAELLNGKRFLIVLDDVWSENVDDWNRLQAPLTSGAVGSQVLVTSRSPDFVGIYNYMHSLEALSEKDCWELFAAKAFPEGSWDSYPQLAELGKRIASKCKGLPLAADTLGSLLSKERDANKWHNVLESEVWNIEQGSNGILPALKLSYYNLPAEEKMCFAFFSLFPKDREFVRRDLIQLWAAIGVIQEKGDQEAEERGSKIFDNLLSRSLLQCSRVDTNREDCLYKMHNLLHDLATSVSTEECFRMEEDKSVGNPGKARHSSWICTKVGAASFESSHRWKALRTLLIQHSHSRQCEVKSLDTVFLNSRYLRVLDLSNSGITELPDSIGNLKLLKYMDLSSTPLKDLPVTICNLFNLQTLRLISCWSLNELPKSLKNLISLCHLHIEGTRDLPPPPQIGKLKGLRTLSYFIVTNEDGRRIGELKDMNELRGSIQIKDLNNVVNGEESGQANLKSKRYLNNLWLGWDDQENTRIGDEEVLESLQPHSKLKVLSITNYFGLRTPSWFPQLAFLKEMNLWNADRLVCLNGDFWGSSTIPGFPSLEILSLRFMPSLEEWTCEMPRLHKLILSQCPRLRQLPRHLPCTTLRELLIQYCPKLVSPLPALPSLRFLELTDCFEVVMRSVRNLTSITSLRLGAMKELDISLIQGLQDLPSLRELRIYYCQIRSLADLSLPTNLTSLEFYNCQILESTSSTMSNLTSVRHLVVWGCLGLLNLSGVYLPRELEFLQVAHCEDLESLPEDLCNLASLQRLQLFDCKKLAFLPMKGLPTNLQHLDIQGCPLLYSRCKKDVGEDWPNIVHIPYLAIT